MDHDVLEQILDGREKPRNLSFELLKNITDSFSEERVIGRGGFGIVYKGVLRNGNVAVKRIMNRHTIDEKLFYREVDSLLKVNHQNVVGFLGFCASTETTAVEVEGNRGHIYPEVRERLLCFEYIDNESLQEHITDELRGLEWDTRYEIIKGICQGLLYLHRVQEIKHLDLKPANVLLDKHMVPKITDFGLSRIDENSQTISADRYVSRGYCAPEYAYHGKMSFKSDIYSLGIIIIEVVTGHRSIPNKNNVLRRWKNRWNKSAKKTPLVCQQVTKCLEIGLLCQENNPNKRPFIWELIEEIEEMDGTNRKNSNADGSTIGQITPYSEDDMLGIEPLELHFPFQLNKQMSCPLQLTNDTDNYIAFLVQNMSPLSYCTRPQKDSMPPRSKCNVEITLQPQGKAPRYMRRANEFIVWSTKVNDDLAVEDITTNMFLKETVNVVDEVNLDVVFDASEPQEAVNVVDESGGSDNAQSTSGPNPSEPVSGMPLKPPSQNKFSARGRVGVRSRYVDTFFKGGGGNSFGGPSYSGPAMLSVNKLPAARFFVPTPAVDASMQPTEPTADAHNETANHYGPSSSPAVDSSFYASPPPPMQMQPGMQRHPSMDNIMTPSGSGNGSFSKSRAASWSGTYSEQLSSTAASRPPDGQTMQSPPMMPGMRPSHSRSHSNSSLTQFNSGGLGEERVGLVSKSSNQAKLGEQNIFYYDENLKRWVEQGAAIPAAAEPPLAPPPTKAWF